MIATSALMEAGCGSGDFARSLCGGPVPFVTLQAVVGDVGDLDPIILCLVTVLSLPHLEIPVSFLGTGGLWDGRAWGEQPTDCNRHSTDPNSHE
jgi:hypothetical protein